MTVATKCVAVIVNPRSGSNTTGVEAEVRLAFAAAGLESICEMVGPGRNATDVARHAVAEGFKTVVACGGDGTVSAVAAAVAGSDTALGVLPCGTLNHFAKDLQLPLDMQGAARVIAAGKTARVDVGEVNGRTFVNNSSLGIYPNIVVERNELERRGSNRWVALGSATLTVLRRYPFIDVSIEATGERIVQRTPFVFIGNNEYAIQGLDIGRRERLDTGSLNLYVAAPVSRAGLFLMAFAALIGRIDKTRTLRTRKITQCRIESHRHDVRVSVDGEVVRLAPPLHYVIRPRALMVIVP